MKHKMYLLLGDTSNDGHGKSDAILYESNYPVEDVRQAYINSCKLTGVNLSGDDCTGNNYHWTIAKKHYVAAEYEQFGNVHKVAGDILKSHGVSDDILSVNDEECDEKYYYTDHFEELWWWFISLSLPGVMYKAVNNGIPIINDGESLNVNFGYGLYE